MNKTRLDNLDKIPVVIDHIFTDPDIRKTEIGETKNDWLTAMDKIMGRDVVELSFPDDEDPIFALVVTTDKDGEETVRYMRVDPDDFGTMVREPEEHGLLSASDKLAEIRQGNMERAQAMEIERAVFVAMQPLHTTLGMAESIYKQPEPKQFDGVFGRSVEQALRGDQGSLTAVDGADLMVKFGTLSSEAQQQSVAKLAAKLGLAELSTATLQAMVTNISTVTRHNDMYNLGMHLDGIHNYQPTDMPERQATVRAWMSAYATGVVYREGRPDSDKAAELKQRLKAVLRSELDSVV